MGFWDGSNFGCVGIGTGYFTVVGVCHDTWFSGEPSTGALVGVGRVVPRRELCDYDDTSSPAGTFGEYGVDVFVAGGQFSEDYFLD